MSAIPSVLDDPSGLADGYRRMVLIAQCSQLEAVHPDGETLVVSRLIIQAKRRRGLARPAYRSGFADCRDPRTYMPISRRRAGPWSTAGMRRCSKTSPSAGNSSGEVGHACHYYERFRHAAVSAGGAKIETIELVDLRSGLRSFDDRANAIMPRRPQSAARKPVDRLGDAAGRGRSLDGAHDR